MQTYIDAVEGNAELVSVLRFLITDDAFHEEFLVTTVIEYLAKHKAEDERDTLFPAAQAAGEEGG